MVMSTMCDELKHCFCGVDTVSCFVSKSIVRGQCESSKEPRCHFDFCFLFYHDKLRFLHFCHETTTNHAFFDQQLATIMPTKKKIKGRHSKIRNARKQYQSTDECIEAADLAFQTQDARQAIELYSQVISQLTPLDPAYPIVLEKRANAQLSEGNQSGAREDYHSALKALESCAASTKDGESDPDEHERRGGLHLYVGQLSEGFEALESYKKGISFLQAAVALRDDFADRALVAGERERNHKGGSGQSAAATDPSILLRVARQQLAAAYCSAAELYLTDLCYEESAEEECESFIMQAMRVTGPNGEPSVDALQSMTNLRLCQKRASDAAGYILQAFERMRVGCQALSSLLGLRETSNPEEAAELNEVEEAQSLPGYEFRCQTVKLLLECAAVLRNEGTHEEASKANQCAKAAVDVLGSLLAENDEVVEIWFLLGEAFAAQEPPNKAMAAEYWEKAQEMLASVKETLEQEIAEATDMETEDELQRQLDDVLCQLENVAAKMDDSGYDEDSMQE